MNTFLGTVRFARPYLARYWPRFVIGIALGVLFGLSNSLLLGSVYLLSPRVTSPDEVHQTVEKSKDARDAVSAQREQKANEPAAVPIPLAKVKGPSFMQNVVLFLDPWLPLRGRTMDWKQWVGGLLFLPAIFLLRGVLGYASSYCLAWSGQRITNDVRTDAFRKVSQQSLDYFQKTPTAEIIKRIDGDSASINNFLRMGLNDLVKEPATIAVCLAWMFSVNWKFTLLSLIYTPLCIIPARIVSKKVKELGRKDFATSVAAGSVTLESFHNVRITKAYALEEVHAQQFRKNSERSTRFFMKGIQSREMLNPAVQTLAALSISLVLLCAMWTNCDTKTLMTFIGALFMFGASVKKLNTMGVFYTQLSIALERLLQLFAMQPTVKEIANPVPMNDFTRAIEFRNVSFSYGTDAAVLHDVSFTLERGRRLGLAGESGSGKSSLINLLFRFYDASKGQILIDGVPLDQLRVADLRFHMALVSQDILLFNGTVAENIALGKIGATRDEVITAAKEAYADKFILELPQGYDTPLGERGQRLSGGQRQRIAIARAFVRNAPVLVLDEATAALDAQSEAEVQKAIDHLAEHRTVICVAHRLSTLRAMDRILVLSQGRVVEQGSFDQLLAQRGLFTAMAARQSIFPQAA